MLQTSRSFGRPFGAQWSYSQREIACHRCRHRKKKCDKQRPVCGECNKSGAECVVLMPKKAPAARNSPSSYVHLLEEHVAALEGRLRQSHPSIAEDHLLSQPANNASTASDGQNDYNRIDETDSGSPPGMLLEGRIIGRRGNNEEDCAVGPMNEVLSPFEFGLVDYAGPTLDSLLSNVPMGHIVDDSQAEESAVARNRPDVVNLSSSRLSGKHLSITVGSRYVSEYFQNAHPMWPFLHQRQWEECWNGWQQSSDAVDMPQWKTFFVDMVLSVGALLVQNSDPASEHVDSAKSLHERGLAIYNSYAIQGRSPVLKTQASLLLTIHAMHSDSVGALFDRASEVMMNCALSRLQQGQSHRAGGSHQYDIQGEIRKQTVRSCYIIDILISYSLDHGISFTNQFAEDELLEPEESTPGSSTDEASTEEGLHGDNSLEEHVFRLRRIQYRILKTVRKLEYEAQQHGHVVPNLWRSQVRHDLIRWADDVSAFLAIQQLQDPFKSHSWLLKLANYTIISLFPNPHLAVRSGDARHLVASACQVLSTFRHLRIKEHTSCYTWTALIHQFQAGIIMVYCLWATPTHQQLSLYDRRAICQAMFACSATLVDFANKWRSAHIFRDIFDLLSQDIPVAEYGDPTQQWTIVPERSRELWKFIGEVGELKVHRKVVSLLEEIARGPRPRYIAPSVEETEWIQYEHFDQR